MKKNKKFFIYSKPLAASGSFRARPQAVFPRLLSLSAPKYPFLTAKERFLTGRTIKKTYQIKLKRYFDRPGTYFARLINNPAGGRVVSGKAFPQTGHFSDSGNYIKLSKLTYQSESKYSAITARLCN